MKTKAGSRKRAPLPPRFPTHFLNEAMEAECFFDGAYFRLRELKLERQRSWAVKVLQAIARKAKKIAEEAGIEAVSDAFRCHRRTAQLLVRSDSREDFERDLKRISKQEVLLKKADSEGERARIIESLWAKRKKAQSLEWQVGLEAVGQELRCDGRTAHLLVLARSPRDFAHGLREVPERRIKEELKRLGSPVEVAEKLGESRERVYRIMYRAGMRSPRAPARQWDVGEIVRLKRSGLSFEGIARQLSRKHSKVSKETIRQVYHASIKASTPKSVRTRQ
jgi:hypothetical protein